MRKANVNGIWLARPPSFDGILPRSSERFDFEPYAYFALAFLLHPGMVAFDVGASYGVMTSLMAKLVGEAGQVHAFEANREVLTITKDIIEANGFKQVVLNNVFVGEASEKTVRFFCVPGRESVASTRNPDIIAFHADAVPREVPMISLDDYVQRSGVYPDVIKIDIEGAEYVAVCGARRVLSEHTPDLVLESHEGWRIAGIGGSLEEFFELVESMGYGVFDLKTAAVVTGAEFVDRYQRELGHCLLSKKLADADFAENLVLRVADELRQLESRQSKQAAVDAAITEVYRLIEERNFEHALHALPSDEVDHRLGEVTYLRAFCLSCLGRTTSALAEYNLALERDFDEFWVRYNRGALYLRMGDLEKARQDLLRAQELDPDHEGVKTYLSQLR